METTIRAAAYLPKDNITTLDHLAPLAVLFNIPLVITEQTIEERIKTFYPRALIILTSDENSSLEYLSKHTDLVFISCKHWGKELSKLMQLFFGRSPRFCYCPHGNSDKGWQQGQDDLLMDQDLTFIYGNQMRMMLEKRGVLNTLSGFEYCGNYRAYYFEKYKNEQRALASRHLKKLPNNKKTFLFAPTWNDSEKSSSFCVTKKMIDELPEDCNLLIKPHPNTLEDEIEALIEIEERACFKQNIEIIHNFPLIYSLCDQVDGYIGDLSSIGYDFLYFNKPLYFINVTKRNSKVDPGFHLFQCGVELDLNSSFFDQIKKSDEKNAKQLSDIRKAYYKEAFYDDICYETLKKSLFKKVNL